MRIRDRGLAILACSTAQQGMTILVGIVLVRLVTKGTFGTYRQLDLVLVSLASLFSLRLSQSLYYFVPRLEQGRRRVLVNQTVLFSLLTALLIAAAMFFGADWIAAFLKNPPLAQLLRIFAFYPFVDLILELVPAFMISLDRAVAGGLFSLASVGARMATVVTIFALGYGLQDVVVGVVVCGTVFAIAGVLLMRRASPVAAESFDKALMWEQIAYTVPLQAAALVGVLNIEFDKLVISRVFDPAVYAVYSVGALEMPVVGLILASVSTAIMPTLVTLAAKGQLRESLAIWNEGTRKCSLVVFPIFALCVVIAPDLMVFLYGAAYVDAAWPFMIFACVLPLRIANYGAMLRAAGRTKPIALNVLVGLASNVVISLALVWIGWGTMLSYLGPSIGTVISQFVIGWHLLRWISRITEVPMRQVMRWRELGWTLLVCVVLGAVVFLLPLSSVWLPVRLAVRIGVYGVLFLGAVFLLKMLTNDEKHLVFAPLHAIRRLAFGRAGAGPQGAGGPVGEPKDHRRGDSL
jgi:O-antigen/teichoic acid export membrane protein